MSVPIIRVRPAPEQRRAMAAWAVAQHPPVRTVSAQEFGVPGPVFTHMPERILRGALVDGTAYVPVPPDDDGGAGGGPPQSDTGAEGAQSAAAPTVPDRREAPVRDSTGQAADTGPDTPDGADSPADAESAASPDTSPDTSVLSTDTAPDSVHTCDTCGREFASRRALKAHRRQAHHTTTSSSGE